MKKTRTALRILSVVAAILLLLPQAIARQQLSYFEHASIASRPHPHQFKKGRAAAAGSRILRAQILLDRAHFSPGQIDGHYGSNMTKAITGYQQHVRLPVTGKLDARTWKMLTKHDPRPVLATYRITQKDVAGPFVRHVPEKIDAQAKLPCACYSSPLDELAERYHISPRLLGRLNPGKHFNRADAKIVVPVVNHNPPVRRVAQVVVTKHDNVVRALDARGHVVAFYPASIGSRHDPLPIGQWKVKGVARHPRFHFNPVLFWDADYRDRKTVTPKGPRSPVGTVWIQLTAKHYGIHGTPNPALVGKSFSHGCIRLTNWDAWELGKMVRPGTPVTLKN